MKESNELYVVPACRRVPGLRLAMVVLALAAIGVAGSLEPAASAGVRGADLGCTAPLATHHASADRRWLAPPARYAPAGNPSLVGM